MRDLIEGIERLIFESKLDVEGFVSGQEPDDVDDEWAADIEISGEISGKEVAQLLGRQQRVLRGALEKLTPEKALALISNGRNKVSVQILRDAKSKVRNFVRNYASDEFGRGARIDDISFGEDDSFWSAKIDSGKEKISFTIEFGTTGRWV